MRARRMSNTSDFFCGVIFQRPGVENASAATSTPISTLPYLFLTHEVHNPAGQRQTVQISRENPPERQKCILSAEAVRLTQSGGNCVCHAIEGLMCHSHVLPLPSGDLVISVWHASIVKTDLFPQILTLSCRGWAYESKLEIGCIFTAYTNPANKQVSLYFLIGFYHSSDGASLLLL